MDMEIIDTVHADKVEEGDFISFDGPICAVKEIKDEDEGFIIFISEDDRERVSLWWADVDIFGYPAD